LTLAAFLATALLGEFVLGLIFGEEIIPYVYLLYPTVISSALIATVTLLGMILVVIRDSKTLLGGSVFGFAIAAALSAILIKDMMYTGTNIAVIVSLSVILIIYLVRFLAYLFKKPKTHCLNGVD
jgi:O-antigen/teichoic acid export membrane protein